MVFSGASNSSLANPVEVFTQSAPAILAIIDASAMRSSVRYNKLRRSDFTILYQFEPIAGHTEPVGSDEKIKVTVTVSYKLSNIGSHQFGHTLSHTFERLLAGQGEEQDYRRFAISGCLIEDGKQHVVWEGSELQQRLKTDGVRRTVSTRVVLPCKQTASVEFTYVILKRAADMDIWLSTVPADGIRIIAAVDGKLNSLQFSPDGIHVSAPVLIRHVPDGGLRTYEWRIDNIVLPFQGMILFWYPNNNAVAEHTIHQTPTLDVEV